MTGIARGGAVEDVIYSKKSRAEKKNTQKYELKGFTKVDNPCLLKESLDNKQITPCPSA